MTKRRRRSLSFPLLALYQSQFKIHLGGGFQSDRSVQFVLSIEEIVLPGIDASQESARRGICRIDLDRFLELMGRSGKIVQVVPGDAQRVMGVRPVWLLLDRLLEFLGSFLWVTFIFQGQGEIVVREGVVGLKLQGLAIVLDGWIPGFLAGECGCVPAVSFSRLRETGRYHEEQ